MAVYAQHKCLAFSCDHQLFPWLLPFFDVRQFSDVMYLEVSAFPFTVLTFVGVQSLQKFASACVLKGERGIIHFGVEDGFSFHVFYPKELIFLTFGSDREVSPTIKHGC